MSRDVASRANIGAVELRMSFDWSDEEDSSVSVNEGRICVVSIVGPPGSGVWTQCHRLSRRYFLSHVNLLSILIQEAMRRGYQSGEEYRKATKDEIKAGLKRHIHRDLEAGVTTFILEALPEKLRQVDYLKQLLIPIDRVIVLDCSEAVIEQRLGPRPEWKHDYGMGLAKYQKYTTQFVSAADTAGKAVHVNGDQGRDAVELAIRDAIGDILKKTPPRDAINRAGILLDMDEDDI